MNGPGSVSCCDSVAYFFAAACAACAALMSFEPHAGQGVIWSSTVALMTPTESLVTVALMTAFPQTQRTAISSTVFRGFFMGGARG